MTKVTKDSFLNYGVSSIIRPGQTESGDLYFVKESEKSALIGVVDGLGHGMEAAAAARLSVQVLESCSEYSIINAARLCHEKLKATRGVVMALVSINFIDETITWLSIGNVEGMLLRAASNTNPVYENIIMRPGVIGYRLPQLYASVIPISKDDLLILSTDGISDDYVPRIVADTRYVHDHLNQQHDKNKREASNEISQRSKESTYADILLHESEPILYNAAGKSPSTQDLADYICRRFAKGNDDALVLVVKYLGKK